MLRVSINLELESCTKVISHDDGDDHTNQIINQAFNPSRIRDVYVNLSIKKVKMQRIILTFLSFRSRCKHCKMDSC